MILGRSIVATILLTCTGLAHDGFGTPSPAEAYNPYQSTMKQYMMLSTGTPYYSNQPSSYTPPEPSAPLIGIEDEVSTTLPQPSNNSDLQSEQSSWWSGWATSTPNHLTSPPESELYQQLPPENEDKAMIKSQESYAHDQKLELIPQKATEDKRDPNIYEQLKTLQEQNKILLELVRCNTEQLQIISEVLGVKFEQSEKNQEEILSTTAALQQRVTYLKKYVESHQSGTWYTLYQCGQTGLQLSKAVGGAALTFKTLSLLPAFVIPGWAVYVSTLAAGSAIYLLKL